MTPPPSRRRFLRLAATGGAAGLLGWVGHAQDPAPPPGSETGAEFITPETQAAIDRGLLFLARTQLDDGSFPASSGSVVGVTAIAGLALMAGGHQPGRGPLGRAVSRAVDFVLASGGERTRGLLAGTDAQHPSRNAEQLAIYGHGFACLFLAEVCGMLPDPDRQRRVRGVLEQAAAYTVGAAARFGDGGWGYDRWGQGPVSDSSVTVAQMMALRAARNAGVLVRKNVIDAGVRYLRACQLPDGGFTYYKGQGLSGFARSAAAIVGLYSAGVYEGREVERGLQYLRRFTPGRQFLTQEIPGHHYYYGQYYAALAMWTAAGDHWTHWFPAIRDELLARGRRGSAGVWADDSNGAAYATAMALIVLQLPNNYLPILQK